MNPFHLSLLILYQLKHSMAEEHIVIIGGGITGLATAYLAAKQGKKVTVLEAGKRFGGLLSTFEIGGNQLEFYYHHFFTHDAELNWMVRELGIEDQLFFKKSTMGMFADGEIHNFNSPIDLLKFSPMSFLAKMRFGFSSLYLTMFATWEKNQHISASKWFKKWAGKEAFERIWRPMLNIKFGPYADDIPLAWMIGRLKQRIHSRKNGEEKLGYLKGSLKTLCDALLIALEKMGVQLLNESPAEALIMEDGKLVAIQTPQGKVAGSAFISTIPTTKFSPLVQPIHAEYAKQLAEIEYFGAVCTILETDRQLSPIYWLNVTDQGFPFGGIIEHTNFIPPSEYNGSHITYLSRYFENTNPLATMTKEETIQEMVPHLKKIYKGFSEDWVKDVHIFKTQTAATVCDIAFPSRIPDCKTPISNLYLANMAHVYPDERSTNNAIRVAAETCKVLGISADQVPYGSSLAGKIGFSA